MTDVGLHLGIEIGKNNKACCPFHKDKTPSLQFSNEKQIVTCFSSNCNFGTQDAIGLTERKLNLNTHEAINYLKEHCLSSSILIEKEQPKKIVIDYQALFIQLRQSLVASKLPKEYLTSRGILSTTGTPLAYNPFRAYKYEKLRGCIIFPLKDKNGKIVNLYGRSIRDNDKAKHYYLADRTGLYPHYPTGNSRKLILTESIIDAETLLQQEPIKKEHEILALYGTNGLTKQHIEAIQNLKTQEIILFFDGDKAGEKATDKYAKELAELGFSISIVKTPEAEDINSLFVKYGTDCLVDLLKNREQLNTTGNLPKQIALKEVTPAVAHHLNTTNPNNIIYVGVELIYYIKGGLGKNLDSLKISLVAEYKETGRQLRDKIELYEYKQVERFAKRIAERFGLSANSVELEIENLTQVLDDYRLELTAPINKLINTRIDLTPEETKTFKNFGKSKGLLKKVNDLIGESGVVGEQSNRLFLFVVAVSHLMKKPLNVIIQGSSGSGKSYLIKKVSYLVPQEKVKRYTRLSEKSFYNFGEYDLCNTLIIIEDYDGMNEEVEYAFREIQSNGSLISAISAKENDNAEIQTKDKIVRGPIASMVATTKGEVYHDNSTRVFFISVDESKKQTTKIIDYKNCKANGEIKTEDENKARDYLQKFVSTLKPLKVKNPYLKQINLPVPHDQLRRLHELLEAFASQVTLIHQHQRSVAPTGGEQYVITEKEDMRLAIDLLFDSIVLKVDELNGSLRDFYERLKEYILKKGKDYEFTRIEIRKALNISKTKQHQYINQLIDLEYIFQSSGYANKGYRYRVDYWDDNQKLRKQIRESLNNQLDNL